MAETETAPNPFEFWSETVSAWVDLNRKTGEQMLEAFQSYRSHGSTEGAETATREIFRQLSDFNLKRWEVAAKYIEAMPDWMRWPQTVPGSVITDWFDRMNRSGLSGVGLVEPFATVPAAAVEKSAGMPDVLPAPVGDVDDLTRIKGIGPKLSQTLNELGIYHFKQIAGWGEDEARWIDETLSFRGRVAREQWVEQAKSLISNGRLH